ncbi:hypothetical protein CVT24_007595 [Panaeolus cyanescens]|uniref:Uncharacterized protein n=1 Tax=Panaeolus cyanescens TaxID=181874 RepID=A0A409XA66_9AGAR|nr:hypothetical protein CVT24_007595 [Panaeolus cyanescens]
MLDPSAEHNVRLVNCIVLGSGSVFLWDWLDNIRDDYVLAFKTKVRFPTIIYFAIR